MQILVVHRERERERERIHVTTNTICLYSLATRDCVIYYYEIHIEFSNWLLLELYTKKMFKARTLIYHVTFKFLCEKLGLFLKKQQIYLRIPMSI
jgi:hypothetical protein